MVDFWGVVRAGRVSVRVGFGFRGLSETWPSGLVVYLEPPDADPEFESPVAFCVRIWNVTMGYG